MTRYGHNEIAGVARLVTTTFNGRKYPRYLSIRLPRVVAKDLVITMPELLENRVFTLTVKIVHVNRNGRITPVLVLVPTASGIHSYEIQVKVLDEEWLRSHAYDF